MEPIEQMEDTQEVGTPFWIKALLVLSLAAVVYLFLMVRTLNQTAHQDHAQALEQIDALKRANQQQADVHQQQIRDLESSMTSGFASQSRVISSQAQKSHQEVEQTAQQLNQKLSATAQQTDQKITQVNDQITDLGNRTQTANNRIGDVDREVGTVKTNLADTQKTLADTRSEFETAMRKVQGDLGITNGYVATNTEEIAQLRRLGERNYTEFSIKKDKNFQRVGTVGLRLDRTDVKRKQFSLVIQSDDIQTVKRDRSPNEPLQFYQGRALFEVVVNTVSKDQITGYISAPRYPAAK
jgi:chromosome segregation ATPase